MHNHINKIRSNLLNEYIPCLPACMNFAKMSFYNHCRTELKDLLLQKGFEDYRAEQIFTFFYRKSLAERFIPKKLMEFIQNNFDTIPIGTIEKETVSGVDGTRKLLIELGSPKYKVESNSLI